MAQFASESFTAAAGTTLQSLSNWTKHSASDIGDVVISDVNRARAGSGGSTYVYYHSGTPATADYSVSADVVFKESIADTERAGVIARIDTAAQTYYLADFADTGSAGQAKMRLYKAVAGVFTQLVADSSAFAANAGDTINIKLEVIGATINAYKNGSLLLTATDSSISVAGKVGIRMFGTSGGNTTGWHMDNLSGDDAVTSTILEEDGEWPWVTQNW